MGKQLISLVEKALTVFTNLQLGFVKLDWTTSRVLMCNTVIPNPGTLKWFQGCCQYDCIIVNIIPKAFILFNHFGVPQNICLA